MDTLGSYRFTVEAVDRAGNPAVREIFFNVDKPGRGNNKE